MEDSKSDDSISDHYDDDPIIVFDAECEDDKCSRTAPISFGFRQPSFVRLHGEPIPKGFGSLADYKAMKAPVKVEPFHDIGQFGESSQSIHEILCQRNARKWKEMGYDPNIIEKSLNRNTSQTAFSSAEINLAKQGKISSSFTNIDSLKDLQKNRNVGSSKLETVVEDGGKKKNNGRKLTRSLSSGEIFPLIEMPNDQNLLTPFCTDLFKNVDISAFQEYSDDEQDSDENDEECNIPINLRPFIVHDLDSLTYKALNGEVLDNLQESTMDLVIDNLNYYLDVAIENDLLYEVCYIQVIIEKIRNKNNHQSVNEMSEIDYRINETSADIDYLLRMFVLFFN